MVKNNKIEKFWELIEQLNFPQAKDHWENLTELERNTIRLTNTYDYGMAIVPAQVAERWDIFHWLIVKNRIRMEYGIAILAIRAIQENSENNDYCYEVIRAIFEGDLGYKGVEDIHSFIYETIQFDDKFTNFHVRLLLEYAAKLINGCILYEAFKRVPNLMNYVYALRNLSLQTILSAYSVSFEEEAQIRYEGDSKGLDKVYDIRKQIIKILLTYITDSRSLDNGEPGIRGYDEINEYKTFLRNIVNDNDFLPNPL